jgi:hypothetical protein
MEKEAFALFVTQVIGCYERYGEMPLLVAKDLFRNVCGNIDACIDTGRG